MAKQDVPSFLQNLPDETDAPAETTPTEEKPTEEIKNETIPEGGKDEKTEEKPKTDASPDNADDGKSDESKKEEEKPEDKVDDGEKKKSDADLAKKEDKPATTEQPKKEEKNPEKTPQETKLEALEKQIDTLTKALEKATSSVSTTKNEEEKVKEKSELDKNIEYLRTTPVFTPSIPKAAQYKMEDGTYDIDSWLSDSLRVVILEMQKSLVGGPLAAAQFGILKGALTEESNISKEALQADIEASEIEENLYKAFPRLKNEEKAQSYFANAVQIEKMRRVNEAKGDKTKAKLTYEEYAAIAQGVLSDITPVAPVVPQKEDLTENKKGGPQIQTDATPVNEEMKAIQEMREAKQNRFF